MAISNRQFQWLERRFGDCYDRISCSYNPHDYEAMLDLLKNSKVLSNFTVTQVWCDGIEFTFIYSNETVTGYFGRVSYGFDITNPIHYHPFLGFVSF